MKPDKQEGHFEGEILEIFHTFIEHCLDPEEYANIEPDSPNQCPEWAIVDLQGSLETRQPVPLGGKFVGDLHFTKQNVPILIIGHHILYGKIVDMEKPFAVIMKDESSETATDRDTDKNTSVNYVVKALIKKKLLFKQRPKPIIANIPKKL